MMVVPKDFSPLAGLPLTHRQRFSLSLGVGVRGPDNGLGFVLEGSRGTGKTLVLCGRGRRLASKCDAMWKDGWDT